ncbi:uncharacterized protein LOC129602542 [Paramacrobiotus metropolitanus]|uniref:uncharacterized protein LOC129602542 n=1 Tax=Paramacrobiotus metropolitanus TaxID=2943436 RepID=UPI002445C0E9|nr:uncharacterized protein LOC129602542 [Paramacrobiotus metropolitanus]
MNTLTYFSVKHAAPGRSRGVYLNDDHAIFHSDYYCAFYPHKDLGRAEEEVYRVYDGQATQFWFDAETGKCGGIRAVVHAAGWTILNDYGELKAGGGLYWGARNSLSTLNRAFLVRGQQDQKRAEIWAVTEAIRLAWKERFSTMTIITDSDFTINCILEGWLERWKADHWLDIHNHLLLMRRIS